MTTTTVLEEVGMDPAAVQELENLFRRQIDRGLHPGAGLAVYRHGRLAVDLWGGLADDAGGTPVAADTMFILYSSTKPLAAACLHVLWERGQLDWDDTVAQVLAGVRQARQGRGDDPPCPDPSGRLPGDPTGIVLGPLAGLGLRGRVHGGHHP